MKRTRLLVVSLISLLGITACGKNGGGTEPSDETVHVEKVELNKSAIKLQVGGHVTLTAKITPTDATVKDVTFSSDKPNIASVSEQGEVTAHAVGTATITVTTSDGSKTDSCQIEVLEHFENLEIDSLAGPRFVNEFNANTTRLDDVATIQANPNPAKNQYYKNEEGGVDTYKVGSVNPFKFETTAVAFDEAEVESHINAPDTKVELFVKEAGAYSKVENLATYVTVNSHNNEFDFNEAANGKQFKLSISINDTAYSSVSATCRPVEFEFEVFDGYNVYSKEELSLFDNRSVHPIHASIDDTTLADPWAQYKESNETLRPYKNVNLKGMALHTNINILNTDVPATMKVTAAQVATYKESYPSSIPAWVEKVNASGDVEVSEDTLVDSLKDYSSIYYRVTNDDEFQFEGNYFTIDASKVKQVCFLNRSIDRGTLHNYGVDDPEHEMVDGCHAQLFNFNGAEEGTDGAEGVARGGKNTLKNVTLIGNGKNVASELYLGGMIMYKVAATELKCQNIISSDTFITFLTRFTVDYAHCHEPLPADDSPEAIAAFEEVQPGEPVLTVDRYKSFDSYNSMFYIWGTRKNTITNSFMKGAGGPLFILDEVHAETKGDEVGKADADKATHGFVPRVDATNVYFENWVTGQEPWFVTKRAEAAAAGIAAVGGYVTGIGSQVYAAAPEALRPYIATTTRMYPDNPNPDVAAAQFINLIAVNICASAFDTNNSDGKGAHLEGQFNINNTLVETLPNVFSLNMSSIVPTALTPKDYTTPEQEQLWTGPQFFRQAYMAGQTQGMIFVSQSGESFMIGSDDAYFFNKADGLIYPLLNGENTATEMGQLNAGFKAAMGDTLYGLLYPNDIFQPANNIANPTLEGGADTLAGIAMSNYFGAYIKPGAGTAEFIGAVLGTVPLIESGCFNPNA